VSQFHGPEFLKEFEAQKLRAIKHLKKNDPKLAAWIKQIGKCDWTLKTNHSPDWVLIQSIVFQQISISAGSTIFGRVQSHLGKLNRKKLWDRLLQLEVEALRPHGLSGQKIKYIKDLAQKLVDGSLNLEDLPHLSDEQVLEQLIQVKGIGRWTAEMFMMFYLGRMDILATADIGLQRGAHKIYGLKERPTPQKLEEIGAKWAPYRSVASWYLWRAIETDNNLW